jgi:beta-glucosidase
LAVTRPPLLLGLALLGLLPGSAAAQDSPPRPWLDARLPAAERTRLLLAAMSPREKFWQLFMIPGDLDDPSHDYSAGVFGLQIRLPGEPALRGLPTARIHAERVNAIQRWFVERTRLGVPIIPFEEALHGFAGPGATTFPQAIALAASWDTSLLGRVAAATARETRSRGIRQVLSPVVNLATDVRWGRTEETFGEDPFLASLMAAGFVAAFEQSGVIATPKHFVANVGEGGRDSYPIESSERALRELHFPPFEAAISAGARSIMTAYNSVDGEPATQNAWLLSEVLRRRWGFGGFVISDAAATGGATVLHLTERNTPEAALRAWGAGLDVVFQSSWPQHRPYLEAALNLVPQPIVDSAVARVLRVKFALGLFEEHLVSPDSAAFWNGHASHRELALEAARAGIVLLRNERSRLPLSRALRRVAVIGTDAAEARLGGYSGPGIRPVTILDGIRAALGGGARVSYAPGPGRELAGAGPVPGAWLSSGVAPPVQHGLRGEYFDNTGLRGEPLATRTDPAVDFHWTFSPPARGLATDWYSVRWSGRLAVPAGPARRLGVEGSDGWRLWIDGRLVLDNWRKVSWRRQLAELRLLPGRSYDIRLEFFETTGRGRVRLIWEAEGADRSRRSIDSAVALARRSEVAVVVAGIEEGEFRDRAFLNLPGRQEELIRAVAATGTPVVVVLIGGSAITMSAWLDRVDAVLLAWYPGEEGGTAVADVLFGAHNPSGRLPVTFPMAEGQLPLRYNHKPTGRGDDYLDLTGRPLFPFGYGLSYTTFDYSDLVITPAQIGPADSARVTLRVCNSGTRAGAEVVQLYMRDLLASLARPVLELRGFARVHLEPGEERVVTFTLGPADLAMLDRDLRPVVEPGLFRVLAGASSRDIRLRGELLVR